MEGFNGDYDLEIERMHHPENFQEEECPECNLSENECECNN